MAFFIGDIKDATPEEQIESLRGVVTRLYERVTNLEIQVAALDEKLYEFKKEE